MPPKMGSKWAHFTCWSGMTFGKCVFDPFLTIFGPKTAHFQGILGFSEDQNGPPQAQNSPKTLILASHMV